MFKVPFRSAMSIFLESVVPGAHDSKIGESGG